MARLEGEVEGRRIGCTVLIADKVVVGTKPAGKEPAGMVAVGTGLAEVMVGPRRHEKLRNVSKKFGFLTHMELH